MHELSVTQNLLALALRHAEKSGAARITRLNLVVGELASVIDDSVAFYWDLVSKDTPAEGAELTFRRIPGRMRCRDCGNEYQIKKGELACPQCESVKVAVSAGDEFLLESIEVQSAEEAAESASDHFSEEETP